MASKEVITRKEAVFLVADFLKKYVILPQFVNNYKLRHDIKKEISAKEIIETAINELCKKKQPLFEFFNDASVSFFWSTSEEGSPYWRRFHYIWKDKVFHYKIEF